MKVTLEMSVTEAAALLGLVLLGALDSGMECDRSRADILGALLALPAEDVMAAVATVLMPVVAAVEADAGVGHA